MNYQRQKGAVIITTALSLLFILGFMGVALDFGRLFIVKTELQTAMDSCALAAAQELDGASDALMRATSAGKASGNLNKVHFQRDFAGIADSEIEFSDTLNGHYSSNFSPSSNAKYVKCSHLKKGLAPILLQAMSGFSGNADFAKPQSVAALAVATKVPSQTNCLIPVGVCQKSAANPLGFTRGEWVSGVTNDADDVLDSGQFRWLDFTGNGGGTREIKDLLAGNGQCGLPGLNTKITDIGKSGKSNGAVDAWNTRFGIYKNPYNSTDNTPDLTGYAWYEKGDTAPVSMAGRYDDFSNNGFQHHRTQNDPYEGDNEPETDGLKATKGGSEKSTTAIHQLGANRRIITTAVVDCATMIPKGFGCFLMLHPLEKNGNGKESKMWLEFISDATASTNNPCATTGLPGGTSGVRVPSLVQ